MPIIPILYHNILSQAGHAMTSEDSEVTESVYEDRRWGYEDISSYPHIWGILIEDMRNLKWQEARNFSIHERKMKIHFRPGFPQNISQLFQAWFPTKSAAKPKKVSFGWIAHFQSNYVIIYTLMLCYFNTIFLTIQFL